MKKFADLHIHTHFSDSTLTPEQIIEEASHCKIDCIAIADHDTVAGIAPTRDAAMAYDLEVVAGVELSSELDNQDIHILGYFVDFERPALITRLKEIQNVRMERIVKMIEKLKHLGVDNIHPEEVYALSESSSVGRPHLAMVLHQKGWVKSLTEAFDRYIAEGAPAYVKKYKQTPHEAIDFIRQFGGVAVLAHPMITKRDEIIPSLVKAGLKGIEVYYPNVPQSVMQHYLQLAKKYHLIATGGSDAHGSGKMNTFIGKAKVSYSAVEELKSVIKVK